MERVTQGEGITKQALIDMRLLDSFVKESIRFHGIISSEFIEFFELDEPSVYTRTVSAIRLALKDYSLSDGTFFPAGTHIAASTFSIHHDENIYLRSDEFIPFRFANEGSNDNKKLSASTTSIEYLPFGFGKQSWYVYLQWSFVLLLHVDMLPSSPGRYLAIAEIKAIMAHIIMNYDFKVDGYEKQMPKSTLLWAAIVPNTRAKLAFRKRQKSERIHL